MEITRLVPFACRIASGTEAWHTTTQATPAWSASEITSGWWPQMRMVSLVSWMASSPPVGRAMVTRPLTELVGVSLSCTMEPSRALTRLNTGTSSISGWSTERMSWAAMVLVESMPKSVPSSSTTGRATVFSSRCRSCQARSTVTALFRAGGVSKLRSLTWVFRSWISTGGSKP